MKEKIKRLTKKKWFVITASVILVLALLYGIGRVAFASYGVVEWEGEFQYSTNNWNFGTTSYITVKINDDFVMDGRDAMKFYANKGNGFTRTDSASGNGKDLAVDRDKLIDYLEGLGYTFEVGDTIYWSADAKLSFYYKDEDTGETLIKETYDTIEEGKAANNESSQDLIDGFLYGGVIIGEEFDDTGIIIVINAVITDESGLSYTENTAYCHHFEDGGYWEQLKKKDVFSITAEDLAESSSIKIYFKDENGEDIASSKTETGTVGKMFETSAEDLIEYNDNVYVLDSWEYVSSDGNDSDTGTGSTVQIPELTSTSYTLTFTYTQRIVEEHECTYEWGNYNDTYHWYVCSECGRSSEKHAHQMVAGESDEDTGETVYTCECDEHEECPYSYVKHKCVFEDWTPDEYDSYPIEEWEEDYKYNPNEYHWKYCIYDCGKTDDKGKHSAGDWEDGGDGYERKRCKTCGFVMEERAITVNILLNPNGGTFPDGSTEMIEIGPFVYGKATELSVLTDANYFPAMEGKDFFGYYVVEEGLSEAFYKPNWELNILEGQPYFFGTNSNGETYSRIKKAYTVHAQYREPSYEIEYHPMNDLAVPQTMAKSHHDVGKESKLSPVGFYITIPIGYEIGTVAGNVETTADNTFHAAEFLGWATTEERALEGIVDYEDEATVLNLLTHAGTFHLYAVWDYGSIILPNAKSANGGMKLKGWTNSDGDFYSVLDSTGNYTGTATYQLSGRAETMTAEWIPNTYTVSFNANGGTDCAPMEVTYLGTYGTLPETTKKGNTFAGWVNDITGETVYNSTIVTLAGDHTLSAKWNPNPITVTLEYCFDSVGTSENYGKYATNEEKDKLTVKDNDTDTFVTYYNEFYSVLSTPFMDGYTFAGWYTEKGADGCGCGHSGCLVSNNTRISNTENHSVYAKWTEKQYKIYLDTNQDYTVEE